MEMQPQILDIVSRLDLGTAGNELMSHKIVTCLLSDLADRKMRLTPISTTNRR